MNILNPALMLAGALGIISSVGIVVKYDAADADLIKRGYAVEVEACIQGDDCEYFRPAVYDTLVECMSAAPSYNEGENTPTIACVNLGYGSAK